MFHYFVFIHVSLFCIHPFHVIILFFLMLCGKGRDAVHGDDAVYVLRPKAAGSLCQRWCQRSTVAISRCARAGTCVPTSITSRWPCQLHHIEMHVPCHHWLLRVDFWCRLSQQMPRRARKAKNEWSSILIQTSVFEVNQSQTSQGTKRGVLGHSAWPVKVTQLWAAAARNHLPFGPKEERQVYMYETLPIVIGELASCPGGLSFFGKRGI